VNGVLTEKLKTLNVVFWYKQARVIRDETIEAIMIE
jgi:hypothetical protein